MVYTSTLFPEVPVEQDDHAVLQGTDESGSGEGYKSAVLGKLLLMQSTLHVMPDDAQRASFLIRGFSGLDEIDGVALFLCDKEYYGENRALFEPGFSRCRHYHEKNMTPPDARQEWHRHDCLFTREDKYIRIDIRTSRHFYGCCILHTCNLELMTHYLPFIGNTIALLAILTENERQKNALEQYNNDLASAVKERTSALETEILERREIEARLQHREQELFERNQFVESLVNLLPEIVYVYDIVESKKVFSNDGVVHILGYTPEEVREMGAALIKTLMHPDDFKGYLEETFPRYLTAGDGVVIDHSYRMMHHSGEWRWLLCREVIYNRMPDGSPRQILGVISDITTERVAQEKLRETEAAMRQAEKMQAVGQLAGGIAHDFNNQLAGIIGYADLLSEQYGDRPDVSDCAEKIITVSRRAADLTSQLLAFSRKGTYLSVDVTMNKLVDEVASMLRRTIDPSIVVTVRHSADGVTVKGDPAQLQNALMNCAINARDAMPGGGRLTMTVRTVEPEEFAAIHSKYSLTEGSYICVAVADTGTGIDEKIRDKIFEPFFTTKDKGKGTGLGLASVYGAVHSHGGVITVDSEVGKGSCFSIYLPGMVIAGSEQIPAVVGKRSADAVGSILLVDDEMFIRDSLTATLERAGYTVATAVDGNDAVDIFCRSGKRFDAVILDMAMPGKNGEETFTELKQFDADVKVVISSGYASSEQIQRLVDDGARFIRKPYRGAELLALLQETIGAANV